MYSLLPHYFLLPCLFALLVCAIDVAILLFCYNIVVVDVIDVDDVDVVDMI